MSNRESGLEDARMAEEEQSFGNVISMKRQWARENDAGHYLDSMRAGLSIRRAVSLTTYLLFPPSVR